MIPKRIIPFFLLKGERLVKGTQFRNFVDVGDPLSQAMIYDAQGAEEIVIVDIEASERKKLIDTSIIKKMLTKCRLPITAGGGIKTLQDARDCFMAGADKIVVNTQALLFPDFIKKLVREFGSQSILVSIDVRKNGPKRYDVFIFSGKQKIHIDFKNAVSRFVDYGVGELIVTCIDREGMLLGFELELYETLRPLVPMPLIASGGSGCYDDIVKLFKETDCDACALGKMLFLRDYDIVRIKSYLSGRKVLVRDA